MMIVSKFVAFGAAAMTTVMLVAAPSANALVAPSPATVNSYIQQVFNLVNSERASLGLPAYRWNSALAWVAKVHNSAMAKYNVLSHQVPTEATLGQRLTAAGYTWTAVGENIGVTMNGSSSSILALHKAMFNEVAPNDGHRRAIVSTTYRDVGIDIRYDTSHGKVWITEDFARHA